MEPKPHVPRPPGLRMEASSIPAASGGHIPPLQGHSAPRSPWTWCLSSLSPQVPQALGLLLLSVLWILRGTTEGTAPHSPPPTCCLPHHLALCLLQTRPCFTRGTDLSVLGPWLQSNLKQQRKEKERF